MRHSTPTLFPHPLRGMLGAALLAASCAAPPPPAPSPAPSLTEAPAASSSAPTPAPAPRAAVPVVVAMVIDQMAAWIAQERWPELPADGGFARLRREGTWVREAHHPHAATDTAPGHAVLFTGAPPSETGIFGNESLEGGKRVSILRDTSVKMISARGQQDSAGSSPARLRVDALADRLKKKHPEAFVAGFSLKDRGSIFGCGRKPDACLWFDTGQDGFVTSTAFATSLPSWAREEASAEATARARQTPWTPLDEAWVRAHARTPDEQPGEGDWGGLGRVFPHRLAEAKSASSAFRASPAGDQRVLALASAALREEAPGKVPTLLTISLSSNDYVGHIFGPDSWEAWDQLRRLDAALAAFFKNLDARFGPEGYALVLSADHGVVPMPETHSVKGARPWCAGGADRWQRPCARGGRLFMDTLAKNIDVEVKKSFDSKHSWVAGIADPYLYLTAEGKALPAERRKALLARVTQAAKKNPCVARVVDVKDRPAQCPPLPDESEDALICRSIPSPTEVDFYVLQAPGCFFDSDYVQGFGTSHGTPYLHDRAVPVLARAPGRVAAGVEIAEVRPTAVFAATVASLLGLDPPEATRGVAPLTAP